LFLEDSEINYAALAKETKNENKKLQIKKRVDIHDEKKNLTGICCCCCFPENPNWDNKPDFWEMAGVLSQTERRIEHFGTRENKSLKYRTFLIPKSHTFFTQNNQKIRCTQKDHQKSAIHHRFIPTEFRQKSRIRLLHQSTELL